MIKIKNISDAKLLDWVREEFKLTQEHWRDNYNRANENVKFLYNEEMQWQNNIREDRVRNRKPVLAMNELLMSFKVIVNRQQTNKIAIKTAPSNDEANVETAEFLEDATRAVENKSKGYVSYEWAFKYAVAGGIGWYRVLTDYENNKTFDQEPKIERILNAFSVFPDRHSSGHVFQDSEYFFITGRMDKEEHDKYVKSNFDCTGLEFDFINDDEFIHDDHVQILEVFYKSYETKTLIKYADQNGVQEIYAEDYEGINPLFILEKRKVEVPTIKWIKTNGYRIFERTDWLGDYIPIIPCVGDEIYIDGKRHFQGLVENSKNPQKWLNWTVSQIAEQMGLANKAKWIGYKGQFTDPAWKTANTVNHNHLSITPTYDKNGQLLPPPIYNQFEPNVQVLTQQTEIASNFIKSTNGVYNAALGERSNETTGKAIERRNAQTEITNYNFANNLESSVEYCGTVLVNLMFKIWQDASKKRIMKEDGTQKIVPINQPFMLKGKEVKIDLTKGEYAVTVTAGASYATKREQQANQLRDLYQVYPQAAVATADIYARDIGANEAAERLKKMLPPELQEQDNDEQAQVPQKIQQELQQNAQTIEMLTKALNEEKDKSEAKAIEVKSKEEINEANNISKEKINTENNQVKLVIEEMKADMMDNQILFTEQMKQIQNSLSLLSQKEAQDKDHDLQREQMQTVGQNIPQQANAQEQQLTATVS
jgi:hypothetical protein